MVFSDGPPHLLHHQLTPVTNVIVSDFWQWLLVHMWVEITVVSFITVIVAYLLRELVFTIT